jgi:general secretion pathway protein L
LPTLDAFSVHAGAGVATWARALAHQLHVEAQPSTSPSRVPASRALKQASPVSQFVDEAAVWEKWHRYSEPAALTQAEAALGVGFQLEAPAARWLRVAQSDWDLAQFDLKLSAQARRSQRLHQVGRHILHSRPWRAARWGVAALGLSAVSVVAALTWQEQDALNTKQQRIRQTLTDTFPHITLVLDAPVQMQRELTSLQRSRGQLGQGDIEVLLHDVGGSIPSEALIGIESNASVNRLRFAAGAEPVVQAVTAVLTQRGWQVQRTGLLIEAQRHTKNTGGF